MKIAGLTLGILLAVAGLVTFLASGQDYSWCSSTVILGGTSTCRAASACYHGGIIAMVAGVGLFVCALVVPSKRRI